MTYIPAKGDIVYINFDPQVGKEQRKRRSAVVISPQKYNKHGFVPITQGVGIKSSIGFKVCIDDGNDKVSGHVLCD